ncbi:MAG: hypothetical protein LBF49_00750 [Puniceicoccales bacterium]|nr:hypothetical protein [Puniceicoccales bacterium]
MDYIIRDGLTCRKVQSFRGIPQPPPVEQRGSFRQTFTKTGPVKHGGFW